MTQSVANRYEFLFLFDCENGNPNGDPDAGNEQDKAGKDEQNMVRPEDGDPLTKVPEGSPRCRGNLGNGGDDQGPAEHGRGDSGHGLDPGVNSRQRVHPFPGNDDRRTAI